MYVLFFVVFAHLRSFPKIKGDAPRHFDLLTRVYGSRHRPDLSSIGKHNSRLGENRKKKKKNENFALSMFLFHL